jgi:hypothetical protein
VITTVPSADRQKATVRVRIGFDLAAGAGSPEAQAKGDQLDPRILPDMGVKVSFLSEAPEPVSASAPQRPRLVVPKSAVRTAGGTQVVFVVRGDRVERRAVKVGLADGDQVEVESGLSPGDRVVTDVPATLIDGARIKER